MPLIQENKILQVKKLTVSYAEKQLILELSFCLERGQTLALVGQSGSGKSLTALAILNLLAQELTVQGQIYFEQENLLTLSENEKIKLRGQQIALIFQEPMMALNPLHRVEKIIGEMLVLRDLSKQQIKQRILDLLNDVGINQAEQILSCYPHQLSGGQRQRVMIAAALALNPKILIADEPTTALDAYLQQQILTLLKNLQKKYNMSMILISHDLKIVKNYADDVLVMQQGRCVEYASATEIFTQPKQLYTQTLLNRDLGDAVTIEPKQCLLKLNQFTVQYPCKNKWFWQKSLVKTVLEPCHITLYAGQSLGVIGESGSGKTSLALAIARFVQSQGEIFFMDYPLHTFSEKQLKSLRPHFQMVFQDVLSSLNPRFTVAQILTEGLKTQGKNLIEINHQIDYILQQVELSNDLKHHYPHQLSGGQRQRVAIARALILQPKMIILDEPTSALDQTTAQSIVHLLQQLQMKYHITYLVISHDLNVIKALCHFVVVLKNGVVIEQQPTKLLFKQPQEIYTKSLIEAYLK